MIGFNMSLGYHLKQPPVDRGESQVWGSSFPQLIGFCFFSLGTHMLHGAGIFTNICPNKITQFCR